MLGGCGMIEEQGGSGNLQTNKNDDTVAMNDEFTQDFISSSEEIEKDFYLYQSMTKGYTMLFPKSAKVEKGSYERNQNVFESVGILEEDESTNLSLYYKINYDNQPRANDIDSNLRLLSTYTNYDGEYEKIVKEGITYYYSEHILDYKGRKLYQYFAYIKPNISEVGASFVGDVTCYDKGKSCSADSEDLKEKIKKIMFSIEFNSR